MVATARLAAGLSGLRNRNTRVTNKTQLRVVKGNIEADPIILDDDDDEKNRILASQGVDEEDANEHHLQAALFASSQRTAQFKPKTTTTDPNAFIPTPDAAGLVAEYDKLYPSKQYKDPATHLRFSDSLDESCVGGLAGSFTYFLDERDAEWLAKNNGAAKGEGTSSGTAANGTGITSQRGMSRTPQSRSAKGKGKESERLLSSATQRPTVYLDESHFELIMGLFEKWTDEIVSPYLHLDPEHFPDFNNYYDFFTTPLPPSTFATFEVPSNTPAPEQMVSLARAIYPWWKERRMERNGLRIIPQLHVLIIEAQEKEDKTGGSPYTCFRKRDVKPMRKTRTNNVTHTEKLTRLRSELQSSLELAQMVLQREKLKRESASIAVEVWRDRETLADCMRQLNGAAPGSIPPADELLLFDKERKPRKPRADASGSGRIILAPNRRPSHVRGFPDVLDPHSPLTLNGDTSHAFEECQKWPSARTTGIQREVEKELLKVRKEDTFWEDLVDMPHQPVPVPFVEKLFKPFLSPETAPSLPSSSLSGLSAMHDQKPATPPPSRVARSLRLRTGRGGRMHLDRRLHVPTPHRLLQREWAGYPRRSDDLAEVRLYLDRWASRTWRPRDSDVRHVRRERKLGEEFWAHPSIYDGEHPNDSRIQSIREGHIHETQDLTFGFEQSITGWDARELWARARMNREEEGWKPTPHLAVDPECLGVEVTTRHAAERERIVQTWRAESSTDGGALALFTDGSAVGEVGDQAEQRKDEEEAINPLAAESHAAEVMERAWRLDERWRYDAEGHDTDDRFLLDDYQPKFLRTKIRLLDARDHETIRTDPQLLASLPPKQNRYLDHQLRLRNPGLPQLSSPLLSTSGSSTPHSVSLRPIPLPSRSVPSPSPNIPNGTGPHPRPVSLESTANIQNTTSDPSANGIPTPNGNLAQPMPTSLKPNGAMLPGGARLPSDSGMGLRLNTPLRTKYGANGISLSHSGLSAALANSLTNNNHGDTPNGTYPLPLGKGYPSLKNTLDRVIAAHQDPQLQQAGRSYQMPVSSMNGVNGGEHATMNMSLGVGNLQLKLPTQRSMPVRLGSVEEKQGDSLSPDNSTPRQTTNSYSLPHPQHLSLSRPPPTSTRMT